MHTVTLPEMIDLLDFRVDLELSNLRRAAGRITESDIRRLRELQLHLGHDYSREVMPHWSLNMQFHMAIVDALAAGDIATAEQMLRKDILAVKEEIQLSLK